MDDLAELAERLGGDIVLAREFAVLLEGADALTPAEKAGVLADFCAGVEHELSGETVAVPAGDLARTLREMARHMRETVRAQEVLSAQGERWFNSYYDDHGRPVEGEHENGVRMMLTGQVFALMSGTADGDLARAVVHAADRFLYDEALGGYRLNTDFGELKTDLGRLFGFAYGHKENGAVFSHMAVMYAYALYTQGLSEPAEKALRALYRLGVDFPVSRIYPGIPEYYNAKGRGMYHYLTGSASWLLMTVLTRQFGVRGAYGDLLLDPQLSPETFDAEGCAAVRTQFAGKDLTVRFENPRRLPAGSCRVTGIRLDGREVALIAEGNGARIPRETMTALGDGMHLLAVTLG